MNNEKSVHEKYMRECLTLAKKGVCQVSPNPMVGCIIVKNGKVVGRGYHKIFRGPHAEVFALANAGKKAVGSTLYVTLEPCSHFGKTPPCVDFLVRHRPKRVVIAMQDPFPAVAGRGIQSLRDNSIQVDVGVLDESILVRVRVTRVVHHPGGGRIF